MLNTSNFQVALTWTSPTLPLAILVTALPSASTHPKNEWFSFVGSARTISSSTVYVAGLPSALTPPSRS